MKQRFSLDVVQCNRESGAVFRMDVRALNLSSQDFIISQLLGNSHLKFNDLLNEVHLWAVDLDQWNLSFLLAIEDLPETEANIARRFRFETHRIRYIKGHYLLRLLLGQYIGIDFYNQEFNLTEYGKPSLQKEKENNLINFSLSNSGSICVYAFTKDVDLGIDIEKIHDLPDMDQIMERFFSPDEKQVFCSFPEDAKKTSFFKYWTRKEALLKAMGIGLSFPLDRFDVLSDGDKISQFYIKTRLQNLEPEWTLLDIDIFEGFASALAFKSKCNNFTTQINQYHLIL